jgi:HAD superfamily hydrolase (TIGR01662 family)
VTAARGAASALVSARAILLDFDGPVCAVFAGYPAFQVAAHLRDLLRIRRVPTDAIEREPDPLEVLRWTATHGRPSLTAEIDSALRDAEVKAVQLAEPTNGAAELITRAHSSGRQVAIVSNNSTRAVCRYLTEHRVERLVTTAVGRQHGRPDLMKPNPYPLHAALEVLDIHPGESVLIGDSPSDMQAAHAAGVTGIGYANRDGKRDALERAGAVAVVEAMTSLASALTR